MRVFGWRERAALAAGIGAMCLCTLLVSHASQRTTLVADDFAWNRGYKWYPDTPGAYPASKTDWYWNNGGLYDQAHVPGYTTTASYTKAPIGSLVADDFAWNRGYKWYPDTPGAYPASKTDWYWNNGGLYDQAHVPGYTTTASYTKAPIGSLVADDFAWNRGYKWYPDTPGAYPASKTDWYWNNGGLYDQAHVPGYTTTASYTKAPPGALVSEDALDTEGAPIVDIGGQFFAVVPVDSNMKFSGLLDGKACLTKCGDVFSTCTHGYKENGSWTLDSHKGVPIQSDYTHCKASYDRCQQQC